MYIYFRVEKALTELIVYRDFSIQTNTYIYIYIMHLRGANRITFKSNFMETSGFWGRQYTACKQTSVLSTGGLIQISYPSAALRFQKTYRGDKRAIAFY